MQDLGFVNGCLSAIMAIVPVSFDNKTKDFSHKSVIVRHISDVKNHNDKVSYDYAKLSDASWNITT